MLFRSRMRTIGGLPREMHEGMHAVKARGQGVGEIEWAAVWPERRPNQAENGVPVVVETLSEGPAHRSARTCYRYRLLHGESEIADAIRRAFAIAVYVVGPGWSWGRTDASTTCTRSTARGRPSGSVRKGPASAAIGRAEPT